MNSIDLSRYDLEYSELQSVEFDVSQRKINIDLVVAIQGWHWVERRNQIRRFFGRPTRPPLERVRLRFVAVELRDDALLRALKEENGLRVPLDIEEIELDVTRRSARFLVEGKLLQLLFGELTCDVTGLLTPLELKGRRILRR
jgi:hypothetical protein